MPRVPRRLPDGAPQVSLSEQEEHLLGVVDASLSELDLAFVTGMAPEEVSTLLERLADLGLVDFESGPSENGSAEEGSAAEGSAAEEGQESEDPIPDDGIDLSHNMREGIDLLFEQLEFLNHYAVLSVERSAVARDIRTAYLKMAPKFHPDRHFRKRLGPFKKKIEAIFGALTKAHDTLRSAERRKVYDATLPSGKAARKRRERPPMAPTPAPSPSIVPPPAPSLEPAEPNDPPAVSRMPAGALRPPRVPRKIDVQARLDAEPSPAPRPVQRRRTARKRPSSPPQSDEQRKARRDALARKLRRGSNPPPAPNASRIAKRSSRVDTGDAAQNAKQSAAEKLRGRFTKIGDQARQRRLKRYLSHGEQAMNAGDHQVAVEAFRQALRLAPRDIEIAEKLSEAERLAGTD